MEVNGEIVADEQVPDQSNGSGLDPIVSTDAATAASKGGSSPFEGFDLGIDSPEFGSVLSSLADLMKTMPDLSEISTEDMPEDILSHTFELKGLSEMMAMLIDGTQRNPTDTEKAAG